MMADDLPSGAELGLPHIADAILHLSLDNGLFSLALAYVGLLFGAWCLGVPCWAAAYLSIRRLRPQQVLLRLSPIDALSNAMTGINVFVSICYVFTLVLNTWLGNHCTTKALMETCMGPNHDALTEVVRFVLVNCLFCAFAACLVLLLLPSKLGLPPWLGFLAVFLPHTAYWFGLWRHGFWRTRAP